ncbi:FmdB family zinc ribbon protein [Noviherbaspirillum sp. UKPF54]|uniref:FmdB family zinc ribbon protein n=1 Tax=Noviherbaspirillum sp. UKPF54 TaxID=2601898 RepID=UPI0011B1ABA7|nr:FmdB family zinc ribbon protein [Noviherbaspirillum sp. UKPF54]QDZ29031.1 zinc ribbon domain-containing protein [Noviherbaspirillum sp. UKPF54]
MPIYAYRCETCGFTKDVLQKVSDAPLTECPSCEKSTFKKQLTAAGFQLKGSGWYVTDFKNGSGSTASPARNTTPATEAPSCGAGECGTGCAAAGDTKSAA